MKGITSEATVRACVDCLVFSANGAGEMDEETVRRVTAGLASWGARAEFSPYTDADTGEFMDSGFTWSSCEVCGLDLGHDYVAGILFYEGGE